MILGGRALIPRPLLPPLEDERGEKGSKKEEESSSHKGMTFYYNHKDGKR